MKTKTLFLLLLLILVACGGVEEDSAESVQAVAEATVAEPTGEPTEEVVDLTLAESAETEVQIAMEHAAMVDIPEDAVDITDAMLTSNSTNCADYVGTYTATARDTATEVEYVSLFEITADNASCVFSTNGVPNHDFNDSQNGAFPNPFTVQSMSVRITTSPELAAEPTALSTSFDDAILLNGVKLDLVEPACFGVEDGKSGCTDSNAAFRYVVMIDAAEIIFDEQHGHTNTSGAYHYHALPTALYNSTLPAPVIGFAADGFPIFSGYLGDDGAVRLAESSYQVKEGTRDGGPSGNYNGTFVQDYEFVAGSGDLDQCNGMTVDGVYGYYATATYPFVLGCFSGTPDQSFLKGLNANPIMADAAAGQGGGGGGGGQGGGGGVDFAAAAEQLGIEEETLRETMALDPGNFEAASDLLNIPAEDIQAAIQANGGGQGGGGGGGGRGGQGGGGGGEVDFATVAETLNVDEDALTEALGQPFDFEAASEALGIPADEIQAAIRATRDGGAEEQEDR